MTRKTFAAVAAILADERTLIGPRPDGDDLPGASAAHRTLDSVTRQMADLFASENPRFQRERFYTAAGFER